jgi:hypothetical protein
MCVCVCVCVCIGGMLRGCGSWLGKCGCVWYVTCVRRVCEGVFVRARERVSDASVFLGMYSRLFVQVCFKECIPVVVASLL